MSELSKRLCTIANIKPVYMYLVENYVTLESGTEDFFASWQTKEEILEEVNNDFINFNKRIIKVKKCLPNFETNAENFLKLLNWAYKNLQDDLIICHAWGTDKTFRVSNETYHVGNTMQEFYDGDNLQELFIKAIIRVLPSYCDQVRQALQNEEWVF